MGAKLNDSTLKSGKVFLCVFGVFLENDNEAHVYVKGNIDYENHWFLSSI